MEYEKEILKKVDELKFALQYHIDRTNQLEKELEFYKNVYENRVDKYILLEKRIAELEEKDKDYVGFKTP